MITNTRVAIASKLPVTGAVVGLAVRGIILGPIFGRGLLVVRHVYLVLSFNSSPQWTGHRFH